MPGYFWAQWSTGRQCPPQAVRGGTDVDGSPVYVGRARHEGDMLPAKVIPSKRAAYVSWGGKEIQVHNCEIICEQRLHWVPSSNGSVPEGAVNAGSTKHGEALYIARANHCGVHVVGKLHPSHRTCYIPFGGKEHAYAHYEVLVSI